MAHNGNTTKIATGRDSAPTAYPRSNLRGSSRSDARGLSAELTRAIHPEGTPRPRSWQQSRYLSSEQQVIVIACQRPRAG